MKITSKIISVLMCFLMFISMAACNDRYYNSETEVSFSSDNNEDINDGVDMGEGITLEVWHVWKTDGDANGVSFKTVVAAYEAEHPNVEVNVFGTENEAYKTLLKTAISANELPDVFFSWGAGFAKPFVEAGQVAIITDYLAEDALDHLKMTTTKNFTYDGELYGLPYISWAGILYCNEALFEVAGVKIPDTMTELEEAIKVFKALGVIPFSVGAKDAWTAMFFQNASTIRTAGIEMSQKALDKEISFNQAEFIEGAQLVSNMVEAGAFDSDCLAMTFDEAKISFLQGKSPMMYQGSWLAEEIQNPELSEVFGKVVARNFPSVEGGLYNNQFLGGTISGFMLSESCENKAVAAEFIAYVTENMSEESFLSGAGLPTWDIDVEGKEIDPLASEIIALIEEADGFIIAWDTYLTGSDVMTHLSLIQALFAQVITAEEFAETMDTLNEGTDLHKLEFGGKNGYK